jgi:hypothetical protein
MGFNSAFKGLTSPVLPNDKTDWNNVSNFGDWTCEQTVSASWATSHAFKEGNNKYNSNPRKAQICIRCTIILNKPLTAVLIYIQQDATLHSLFYLETALHVSGSTSTHHQDRIQLYLQHLLFVTPLLLPAKIVEKLELSSTSSTIAADSSNGVSNNRCCRYSCLRFWWWVEVPPETCRAVSI